MYHHEANKIKAHVLRVIDGDTVILAAIPALIIKSFIISVVTC